MTGGWASGIEVLASAGFFTGIIQLVRAYLGRGKTRADQAQVVQGMALDLITPYKQRVVEINIEVDELRKKIRALMDQLDATMDRARRAEDELLKHGIPIPWSRQWTETNGTT